MDQSIQPPPLQQNSARCESSQHKHKTSLKGIHYIYTARPNPPETKLVAQSHLPGISASACASPLVCRARESSRFPSALPCPALTTTPSTSIRNPAGLVTRGSSHGSRAPTAFAPEHVSPTLSAPPPPPEIPVLRFAPTRPVAAALRVPTLMPCSPPQWPAAVSPETTVPLSRLPIPAAISRNPLGSCTASSPPLGCCFRRRWSLSSLFSSTVAL